MVNQVLNNYFKLNFTGGILKAEGCIIGFSIGEIINDTLFVHIEKALKQYSGAYETINFCSLKMLSHLKFFISIEKKMSEMSV